MKIVCKEFFDKMNLLDRADIIQIRTNEIYRSNNKLTKLEAFQQSNSEITQGKITSTNVLVAMLDMEFSRNGLTDLALELSQELDKRIVREQRLRLNQFKKKSMA